MHTAVYQLRAYHHLLEHCVHTKCFLFPNEMFIFLLSVRNNEKKKEKRSHKIPYIYSRTTKICDTNISIITSVLLLFAHLFHFGMIFVLK